MESIGVDLHKRESQLCLNADDGTIGKGPWRSAEPQTGDDSAPSRILPALQHSRRTACHVIDVPPLEDLEGRAHDRLVRLRAPNRIGARRILRSGEEGLVVLLALLAVGYKDVRIA